jgi:Protein of unknown function (DUF3237)
MSTLSFDTLPETLKQIHTRPLFVLRETIPPLLVIGETPNAFRRVGVVQGGSFTGDRLSGEVVTGNDWQTLRKDNCMKLDVRMVLKTTDGALITMTYTATRAGKADVLQKLDEGIPVDPSEYYFRMTPTFETGSEKYDWLNRIVAIGTGSRLADGPVYSIFEIL